MAAYAATVGTLDLTELVCSSARRNYLSLVEHIGGITIIPNISDPLVIEFEQNEMRRCRIFWRAHEYRRPPVNKAQRKAPALPRGRLLSQERGDLSSAAHNASAN